MGQSQGRAVTAIRAHGDHGQDKSHRIPGAALSWGCSLQRATCQVQAEPGAEPAQQDLTQM